MNIRLAICKGMGTLGIGSHHRLIIYLTYSGLVSVGFCETFEEAPGNIHMCILDEGSNMLAAWREIEDAGCACQCENNCSGTALSFLGLAAVLKKLKDV